MEAGGDEDGAEEPSAAGAQQITASFLQLEAQSLSRGLPMVADRRAGPAGVAVAGRAELLAGDAAVGRARRPALVPSRGAGGAV